MRTRFLVGASLVSVTLAMSGQLRAQSQDATAAAREVVAALPGDELVRAALANADAQQAGSRPGVEDSTTRAAIWTRLQAELVTLYASAFSAPELREIAAFYRTPTGRRLAAAQVPITLRILAATRSGGTRAQRPDSTATATANGSDSNVDYFRIQVQKPAAELPGNPEPVYPDSLRKAGVTGSVVVQFVVDTTGRVDTSRVLVSRSSGEPFTAAVRAILPQLRYTPAENKGHKVRQIVDKRFVFPPQQSQTARDSTPPARDSTPPSPHDSTPPAASDSTSRSPRDSTPRPPRDSIPRAARDSTPPARDSTPPSS